MEFQFRTLKAITDEILKEIQSYFSGKKKLWIFFRIFSKLKKNKKCRMNFEKLSKEIPKEVAGKTPEEISRRKSCLQNLQNNCPQNFQIMPELHI